jgi:3D (Asp-Asp-Asp) domain-containing protein
MLLARSFRRKAAATVGAALGFVLLYEVTTRDSRSAAELERLRGATAPPAQASRLRFTATAYCKGIETASGVNVRHGIAAADRDLLPLGSIVQVDLRPPKYAGVYTVMDTGPKVRGRHLDLYIWSCNEALQFGRRPALVTVLRLGWNPRSQLQNVRDLLFGPRPSSAPPLGARPLPLGDPIPAPSLPPSDRPAGR